MPEGFALTLVEYSPQTLLGIGILLLFLGLLVPKWVVLEKNKEIDYLRQALDKRAEGQEKAAAQTEKLLEGMKTNAKFLEALLEVKEGGDLDVVVQKGPKSHT